MTTPTPAGPCDRTKVARWLYANDPAVSDDAALLDDVVAAVNAYIRSYMTAPADGAEWPDDVVHGATMLAARNVRRRNSPAGVETGGDGGAVYVARRDRDLDQFLRLGDYRDLVIG